jgi:NADPH2:quinone reductase
MKAVWYDKRGPAREVLQYGELPTPKPERNQVLIRIHASGVNPSDAGARRGPGPMQFPRVIPHSDGAGVVEDLGSNVSKELLGKRVWFYNSQRLGRAFGSGAEYVELDVDLIRVLPDSASFAEGATLGIPAMTAHRAVFAGGPVQGRYVLVTGGAGAVGHYCVQLAKWAGATVIATVSSQEKAERARAGGADYTIDYKTENVRERIREITNGEWLHHVADVDFGGNVDHTIGALRINGSLAFYANRGGAQGVKLGAMSQKALNVTGIYLPHVPLEARHRAQDDLTHWIATGKRMLSVAGTYELEDAASAHEAVEKGDKVGTVVVLSA